jgi:uncharacterized protein (DUF433 family)
MVMTPSLEFTPSQAAAVTGLSLAAVHKAMDTRLVRPRIRRAGNTVRRFLTKEQLVYLQLEAGGLRMLPVRTRRQVAALVARSPRLNRISVGEGDTLRIEVNPARKRIDTALRRLARAERMAVRDPDIMGGTPVFRGTRIPIQLVADMLVQGASCQEILEGYPSLTKEMVALAQVYVRAFPRRGRPPRRPWAGTRPDRASSHRLASNV